MISSTVCLQTVQASYLPVAWGVVSCPNYVSCCLTLQQVIHYLALHRCWNFLRIPLWQSRFQKTGLSVMLLLPSIFMRCGPRHIAVPSCVLLLLHAILNAEKSAMTEPGPKRSKFCNFNLTSNLFAHFTTLSLLFLHNYRLFSQLVGNGSPMLSNFGGLPDGAPKGPRPLLFFNSVDDGFSSIPPTIYSNNSSVMLPNCPNFHHIGLLSYQSSILYAVYGFYAVISTDFATCFLCNGYLNV